MELLKYGTPESREAQDRMIKHLEQAIHELDEAERLIKQMDDPYVRVDQTRLRLMDTRGRAASSLVYLKKKWQA